MTLEHSSLSRRLSIALISSSFVFVVAACGKDDDAPPSAQPAPPAEDAMEHTEEVPLAEDTVFLSRLMMTAWCRSHTLNDHQVMTRLSFAEKRRFKWTDYLLVANGERVTVDIFDGSWTMNGDELVIELQNEEPATFMVRMEGLPRSTERRSDLHETSAPLDASNDPAETPEPGEPVLHLGTKTSQMVPYSSCE